MTHTIDIFNFLNTVAPFDTQEKWDNNLALKAYFDGKCGTDVYRIVK